MITVVNVRNGGTFEYCGRMMSGRFSQSPLANPHPLLRESDRPMVLAKYASWFERMVNSDDVEFHDEIERLVAIARQGDLNLGCWCAPKACHCDIIKAFLEEVIG